MVIRSKDDRRFVVVGLGEILWDLLPAGKQLGGAPANFAYHAHLLGAEAYVVSCVGSDPLGREIFQKIDGLDIGRRFIQVTEKHPTGTVDVELDAEGNPRYVIHENVAWDFIQATPELLELARRADAVCFGSLCQRSAVSRATIRQFLQATRPECLRIVDINLRQAYFDAALVEESLQAASVLKLNDQELPVVAKLLGITGSDTEIVSKLVDQYGLEVIALTRGAEGSILHSIDRTSRHPGFRVQIADTVGAGDAFTAALVMGLLGSYDIDKISMAANHVASYVCTQPGATPQIPGELKNALFDE